MDSLHWSCWHEEDLCHTKACCNVFQQGKPFPLAWQKYSYPFWKVSLLPGKLFQFKDRSWGIWVFDPKSLNAGLKEFYQYVAVPGALGQYSLCQAHKAGSGKTCQFFISREGISGQISSCTPLPFSSNIRNKSENFLPCNSSRAR